VERHPDGESIRFTFQFPPPTPDRPSLLPYIIPKGYVTIDGTSLTVTEVNDVERTFGIMMIKHTQEVVALPNKPIGGKVNIEVDMVGKYVLKGVEAALSGAGAQETPLRKLIEKVVKDILAKESSTTS